MTNTIKSLTKSSDPRVSYYFEKAVFSDAQVNDIIHQQDFIEDQLKERVEGCEPLHAKRCGLGYEKGTQDRLYYALENYKELCFLYQIMKPMAETTSGKSLTIESIYEKFNGLGVESPEEIQMHLTTIQWLGSSVGFGFLEEALDKCGFEIRPKTK